MKKSIDPANDPLYQLMRRTPNVVEIVIAPTPQIQELSYVAQALSDNKEHCRKLQKLPPPDSDDLTIASAYFKCANVVRHSLKKLILTKGMIDRKEFGRFAEFSQLTELAVGEDVPKDIYDCADLVRYLPHLELLGVIGFQHTAAAAH